MSPETPQKRAPSLREVVVILALLLLLILLSLPVIRNTMAKGISKTCQDNLRQWGAIFALYRAENGHFNPLTHGYESFGSSENAQGCSNIDDAFDFAPAISTIFPDYANNEAILACPETGSTLPARTIGSIVLRRESLDPVKFAIAEGSCSASGSITRPSAGYTYFGFEMKYADDPDLQITEAHARLADLPATGSVNVVALLKRFQVDDDTTVEEAQSRRGTPFERDEYTKELGFPWYGAGPSYSLIMPLNDSAVWMDPGQAALVGINTNEEGERLRTVAVMWDTIRQDDVGKPVFNHSGASGCNVLYMDGHVEFKTHPGPFPVSNVFVTMKAVP